MADFRVLRPFNPKLVHGSVQQFLPIIGAHASEFMNTTPNLRLDCALVKV